MKSTLIVSLFVLVALSLLSGCSSTSDIEPLLSDQQTLPSYKTCIGIFTEYDTNYPWFENWVDKDGNTVHGDGSSPRAVFRIVNPVCYTNRMVGILYQYTAQDLPLPPLPASKGKIFSFELPVDFFTGTFVTIDNGHVRYIKMLSEP